MLLGSHVSMGGKEMLVGSVKEAASYGSTTFMIYTGAPQNTRRKKIEDMRIPEGQQLMAEVGITELVVHAPYIINLANTTKEGYFDFAVQFLREEIARADALGAKQITMHPGAHVGAGLAVATQQLIRGLNEVLTDSAGPKIALETMAGKGTEIGSSFSEIAAIIAGVTHNERLSVTLDTCHMHDAGYDVRDDFDGVLAEFDHIIGLDRLGVVHINDSKNPRGSHKDRHANIGEGEIGWETLNNIVHHEKLADIAKILETPWIQIGEDKKNKKAPYLHEINMFKSRQYNPDLIEDIIAAK